MKFSMWGSLQLLTHLVLFSRGSCWRGRQGMFLSMFRKDVAGNTRFLQEHDQSKELVSSLDCHPNRTFVFIPRLWGSIQNLGLVRHDSTILIYGIFDSVVTNLVKNYLSLSLCGNFSLAKFSSLLFCSKVIQLVSDLPSKRQILYKQGNENEVCIFRLNGMVCMGSHRDTVEAAPLSYSLLWSSIKEALWRQKTLLFTSVIRHSLVPR